MLNQGCLGAGLSLFSPFPLHIPSPLPPQPLISGGMRAEHSGRLSCDIPQHSDFDGFAMILRLPSYVVEAWGPLLGYLAQKARPDGSVLSFGSALLLNPGSACFHQGCICWHLEHIVLCRVRVWACICKAYAEAWSFLPRPDCGMWCYQAYLVRMNMPCSFCSLLILIASHSVFYMFVSPWVWP